MYAGQSLLTMSYRGLLILRWFLFCREEVDDLHLLGLIVTKENWYFGGENDKDIVGPYATDGCDASLLQTVRLQLVGLTPGGCWCLSLSQRHLVPNELNLTGKHAWYCTSYLWDQGTEQQSKFQSTRKMRGLLLVTVWQLAVPSYS